MSRGRVARRAWGRSATSWSGRLSLDAFRLFVPAYLLVYGASLATLPPGLLTQDNPARLAMGYGAVGTGLALLWLNSAQVNRLPQLVAYGFVIGLVAFGAVIHLAGGAVFSATLATGIAVGASLVALRGRAPRTSPTDRPRDFLVLMLAAAVASQGVAFLAQIGPVGRLTELAGLEPVAYGLAMLGSAGLILGLHLRGEAAPPILEWAACLTAGGALLILQLLAAMLVDPLYWLLGASSFMVGCALIASPLWRRRWRGVSWGSLRTRVSAALVTTASVTILGVAAIGLASGASPLTPVAQALFAAVAFSLLTIYVLAWWWGGRLARAQTDLAAAMAGLNPGYPWRAPNVERDVELEMIAHEVEQLAERLVRDKAAATHRADVSMAVERALSSSLRIEAALTGLVDALVPAFSDAAAAYVRRGDEVVRIAVQGPEEVLAVSRYPLRQQAVRGPTAVIRTGKPEFYLADVPSDYFASIAPEEAQVEPLNLTGLMIVPIVGSDGATAGALSVKMVGHQRRFNPYDVASVLDFAGRAALTIENGRLYEAVAEASAAKDEFLGLVSHELRTPITTILGAAALLRRERSAEQQIELAGDIEAESIRLAEIVDNLLAIGRLGLTATIPVEPMRLKPAVVVSIAEARRLAPTREIGMRIESNPIVESNESYIQVVMHNLLRNSLTYSDPAEPIEVVLEAAGGHAVVSVQDRGEGIPEDEIGQIFEPFQRSKRARRKAGIGIGLSVCRRVLEALGGEISAVTRPGGGMVFSFSLPLAVGDAVDQEEPAETRAAETPAEAPVAASVLVGGEGLEPPTFSV